jgi:hypothetical protein
LLPLERPDEFNQLVAEFLTGPVPAPKSEPVADGMVVT